MSEISNNIVSLIVSKEFHKAKMLIHEVMNNKLGILLEEKLLEYAPTLYEQDEEDDHDDVERFFKKDPVAKDPVASYTEYSSAFGGERYNKQGEKVREVQNWEVKDPKTDTGFKTGNVQIGPNGGINTPESNITLGDSQTDEVNNDMSSRDIIKYGKDLALGASGLAYLAEPVARVITSPLRIPTILQTTLEKTARIAQKTAPIVGDVASHSASSTALTASKVVTPVATGAENLLVKTLKYPKLLTKSVGKAFPYLMAANAANDVYQTTMDDTDWKDKPGTAAATLGVDIAKNAVLNAPLFMKLSRLGMAGVGAAIGTGFAQVVNRGIDAVAGTDLANLQRQSGTYDPKNIVNGFKDAFRSKEDIEKETQSEVDEFKKEVESSGRGQAVRDADAEGAKITAQFDADQKKKQALLRNTL